MLESAKYSEAELHTLSVNPLKSADTVEVIKDEETGSFGSPCEFIGLAGSPAESLDRSLEIKTSDESILSSKKRGNKEGNKNGNVEDGDDNEKESKLAEHIANTLRNSLCYDETGRDWYCQTKGLWYVCSEKKALKIIMGVLDDKIPCGYGIAKLNNIKSFLMIYLLLDKWASNRNLLPMANGVLDTKTMQLIDYNHQHRFNWQLPYSFDSEANLEATKRWLWDASGHDLESVNIIRAFFKMALVGGDVQRFLELIGPGGTGKSTLLRLLVAFIGQKNHAATDLKNLETNRFEAAALYGKRLLIISDSSRYGGEVSTLKALTGGDPVRLEKKNQQQSGSFVFDGVVVIASNEAIQTADYTSGLIRRRMPVNFNRKVTEADKIKWAAVGGIEAAMHSELAGLLNWVMAMTEDDVKAVIGGINGQMTQSQRDHLVETNKIAAWMDDNIVCEPNAVTYVGNSTKGKDDNEKSYSIREKLYANYEAWCSDGGVHPVALQRFTANIIDVCDTLKLTVTALPKNKHGRPIKGIAIRNDRYLNYASPVTKRRLGDPEIPSGDPAVTQQTPGSSHGDSLYPITSPVTISPITDEAEYF